MSLKKQLAVAGLAAAILALPSFAELTVTPYGAAQYRLRFQHNSLDVETPDESRSSFDYTNRLCWRTGVRVSHDEALSLQFQIGNDWGAAENVNWNANNSPFGRATSYQNLYAHIASAKWNPGFIFIEAGILSINSNGTLDLLAHSLSTVNAHGGGGGYIDAGFNGWGDMNNSMIGLKVGAPLVKDGVKVGVELFQSVIDNRSQTVAKDPLANPSSMLMVLTVPVDAGALKIAPEFTGVINRNFNSATEEGDHEIIGGLAGSYKVSDNVSVNFNGGYGTVSNANSKIGNYSGNNRSSAPVTNTDGTVTNPYAAYTSSGLLVGAGATLRKLGPGDLQIAINYANSANTETDATKDDTNRDQIYTDIRYIIKLHSKFTFTPRYRTYTTLFPEAHANNMRMDNRLELIVEGSF